MPFFFALKGGVGSPSLWGNGEHESWRGGFILGALETFLKIDMISKFHFLGEIDAPDLLMPPATITQSFAGSTTMVPSTSMIDYLRVHFIR